MTKIKFKVAQPVAPKPAPKVSPNGQSMGMFPKMNHMVQKRSKSIFGKMTDIIIEDIKSIFGKDKKNIEREMALKRFEEMVRK
jgi:hypothetical protein